MTDRDAKRPYVPAVLELVRFDSTVVTIVSDGQQNNGNDEGWGPVYPIG